MVTIPSTDLGPVSVLLRRRRRRRCTFGTPFVFGLPSSHREGPVCVPIQRYPVIPIAHHPTTSPNLVLRVSVIIFGHPLTRVHTDTDYTELLLFLKELPFTNQGLVLPVDMVSIYDYERCRD